MANLLNNSMVMDMGNVFLLFNILYCMKISRFRGRVQKTAKLKCREKCILSCTAKLKCTKNFGFLAKKKTTKRKTKLK